MKSCAHNGCGQAVYRLGFCRSHRRQLKLYGETWDNTPEGRFWRKVDKTDTCWIWTGALDGEGYGSRRPDKAHRSAPGAHRYAYELLVGPIPDGLELDHTCHSRDLLCPGGPTCLHRRCVRPAHLEPVTGLENSRRSGNARKTVCPQGHGYTPENTYYVGSRRHCRECGRQRSRLQYQAARQVAA